MIFLHIWWWDWPEMNSPTNILPVFKYTIFRCKNAYFFFVMIKAFFVRWNSKLREIPYKWDKMRGKNKPHFKSAHMSLKWASSLYWNGSNWKNSVAKWKKIICSNFTWPNLHIWRKRNFPIFVQAQNQVKWFVQH